jgi:hypothetical protein
MEILLVTTYTFLFLFIIRKMTFFQLEGLSPRFISSLFILKILAGLALWAVYTFYYADRSTADIYKYFDDSAVIYAALHDKPLDYFRILSGIGNNSPYFDQYYDAMHFWARKAHSGIYNDSHTIIRFNALARLFSFGYYNVHTVFICFLSFTGLSALYKTFIRILPDRSKELVFILFLFPSVLFWGSGVLKEGLIFFAIGLLIWHSTKLFRLPSAIVCLLTTFLLAFSKFYVWLSVLPGLIFLVWVQHSARKHLFLKLGTVFLFSGILALGLPRITGIQSPLVTLSQKQYEFKQLASGEMLDSEFRKIPVAGSKIDIPDLEPDLRSFAKNAPMAIVNVLLRPFPQQARGPFLLMAFLENILVIVFIILAILYRKPTASWSTAYILFCLSFVLLQFLIIGETTPIVGAITRYRTISLPFLLIAFLCILDKQKLVSKLPFYRKLFV